MRFTHHHDTGQIRRDERTVAADTDEVRRRLGAPGPGTDGSSLWIGTPAVGTLAAASQRLDIGRRSDVARGWVELTPLSPTSTLLEIATWEPGAAELAEQVVTAVCGPPSREPAAAASHRSPWRRPLLRTGAVLMAVLLLIGAGAVYRLLAPPAPLAVDQAVAQFQSSMATPEPVPAAGADEAEGTARPARAPEDSGRRPRQPTAAGGPADRPGVAPPAPDQQAPPRTAPGRAQASSESDQPQRPPPLPEEGVYTYETTGYEEVDQPGGRHDYPAQTALTVHHTDCGFSTRWQPLEQRWDEMQVCTGKVRTLLGMTTQREFYGQRKRSDYRCEPGSRAWHTDAGATWTTRCADKDTTVTTRLQVVGYEPLTIGDTVVEAVHLRLRATLSGGTNGEWEAERWLHPETGLLLRLRGRTDATSDSSVGTIQYHEEVNLDLRSLEPQR